MKTNLIFKLLLACSSFAVCAVAAPEAAEPVTPTERIVLFDAATRDLSAFYTWLPKFGHDDLDGVFTIVERIDGAPAIRISGQHWGGLLTRAAYANYRLVAEYRWGLLTWQPRRDRTRDGGVLFHCQGEPGNSAPDFRGPWMQCVEYQIIEGGAGDLILVEGHYPDPKILLFPSLHTTIVPGTRRWDPAGTPVVLKEGRHRTDWQHKDPNWKDKLGFCGTNDVEKPFGDWNRLEAIVDGGSVTYLLNGVTVNQGRDGSLKAGRILLQSESAEIYFHMVELQPLQR